MEVSGVHSGKWTVNYTTAITPIEDKYYGVESMQSQISYAYTDVDGRKVATVYYPDVGVKYDNMTEPVAVTYGEENTFVQSLFNSPNMNTKVVLIIPTGRSENQINIWGPALCYYG